MAKIIIGSEIGQVVKDGQVVRKNHIVWCKYCIDRLIKDPRDTSAKNKKLFDSCEMKDGEYTEKDGKTSYTKSCPRCHQTLVLFDNFWEEAVKA